MTRTGNRNPGAKGYVSVTVYVGSSTSEHGYGAGLVLDTETLTLTEAGETSGIFRSGVVVLSDTKTPVVNDGVVSWGRRDTMHVVYVDANYPTDTGVDTALAVEIRTMSTTRIYENGAIGDDVDTLLTRDQMFLAVHDTDENRNPQARDTVSVTVYVGNGAGEYGYGSGLVLDTQSLVLTESGETTGVFVSDTLALMDTEAPITENVRISWGRGDTLHVVYADVTVQEAGQQDDTTSYDTALALEISASAAVQLYEDGGYNDGVDTYQTRDLLFGAVQDTDENRNPQAKDTVYVMVYVSNATAGGGAAGLVIDTERIVLTETSETSGMFRSDTIVLTDTKLPGVNDG